MELSAEDFDDFRRWVEISPEYDLHAGSGASGELVKVTTGTLVKTADGLLFQYVGANAPETNLNEGFAYYAVVENATTLKLATSRYGAVLAGLEEGNEVVDIALQSGGDFAHVRMTEYNYDTVALDDPGLGDVPEEFQRTHETYGGGQYDPNFLFQLTPEEKQVRIDARTFALESLSSPVAASLFGFLFPATSPDAGASAETEQTNVLGQNVTLFVARGGVGRVEPPMDISLTDGFDNLPETQRQALAAATKDDVVAVHYTAYRYLGDAGAVDLRKADFTDGSLWEQQLPRYTTTGETQAESVEFGDLVRVTIPRDANGDPQFGVYRYVGPSAGSLDLSRQDYGDTNNWRALAEFDVSMGEQEFGAGTYVGRIEVLTIELWNDVDVLARHSLEIDSRDDVSVASPGDLPIGSVTAGGAVRLRTAGDIRLDVEGGSSITSTDASVSLQAGSDVWMDEAGHLAAKTFVAIAGDYGDSDLAGTNLQIHGQIDAAATKITGAADNDTIVLSQSALAGNVTVLSGSGNDDIRLEDTTGAAGVLLSLDGGDDQDIYRLGSSGRTLDLTNQSDGQLVCIEAIDLTGTGANTLVLDAPAVLQISPGGTLAVHGDSDDLADLGSDWEWVASQFHGPDYFHVLQQAGATVHLGLHPWQNPVFAVDASANGYIEPLDLLLIISRLNAMGSSPLPIPHVAIDAPSAYVDVDGNDHLTPVDLLIAINYINRHGSGPPAEGQAEGESAAMDSSLAVRAASLSSLGPHPIRTSPASPGAETERDADEPAATLQARPIDGREDKDAVFRRVDS